MKYLSKQKNTCINMEHSLVTKAQRFDFNACFPCYCKRLHCTDKLIWLGKSSHFQTHWQKFPPPDISNLKHFFYYFTQCQCLMSMFRRIFSITFKSHSHSIISIQIYSTVYPVRCTVSNIQCLNCQIFSCLIQFPTFSLELSPHCGYSRNFEF